MHELSNGKNLRAPSAAVAQTNNVPLGSKPSWDVSVRRTLRFVSAKLCTSDTLTRRVSNEPAVNMLHKVHTDANIRHAALQH
jgi:hypothetical protein